jgi:leucyl aminopeptidase (aminopeptidase T)
MIFDMIPNLELIIKDIMKLKKNETLLLLTDTHTIPMTIGQTMMDLAVSRGFHAVMTVMPPRTPDNFEPPEAVASAMLQSDVIYEIVGKTLCAHSTARTKASEAGIKYYYTVTEFSDACIKRNLTPKDLEIIQTRSDAVAKRLTQARVARLTTPFGTDISMNLENREGLSLHPLTDPAISGLPDYAESCICPVEGSSEGTVVVDASVQEWGYTLREPLRLTVNKGRLQSVEGDQEDVEKFEALTATDENAKNCVAELGIGTSHTLSDHLVGSVYEYALLGTVHIALGRNDSIGGKTFSRIHKDVLMTKPTLELDGDRIMENGLLRI